MFLLKFLRRGTGRIALLLLSCTSLALGATVPGPWSEERAQAWMRARPYLAGGNYVPQNAINQLEMWQPETFDPAMIDREFGWARAIGFRTMRVFLHNLPWREDPLGFLARVEQFLAIAEKHQIQILFVFFDSCWDPNPRSGPQRPPRPYVHNSGWVQSPGIELLMNARAYGELEAYVKHVLGHFRNDRRIVGWDLFNEPNNAAHQYADAQPATKADHAFILLRETFRWARAVNPSQPLTAGPWEGDWSPGKLSPVNAFMFENSDVISFHCYGDAAQMRARIATLERYRRPLLCTEFMARTNGSRFETHLPLMKEKNVTAIAWGFVAGRSQTQYPWDSWKTTYTAEPPVWFHDVLRPDGTPFDAKEVDFLKRTLQ